MNDQHILEYLRSRGQVEPPLDLTRSVMTAIEAAPPPRSWFSAYLPAFAVAGAVAVVAVLAVLVAPVQEVGPAPTSSATPSATPSATETQLPRAGELEGAVTEAYDRLADAPGVQGVITSNVEGYLASATWFDWRPTGDEVVVTTTDIDVSQPWWTDSEGAPLTVGERIETAMSVVVDDHLYRTEDDAWVADESPGAPLTFWTSVLDGRIPAVGGLPADSQEDRRNLADGTTVWVLVSGSDDSRTITEWTVDPDGVLASVSNATEQTLTPEQAGSTGTTVEFTPLEDAGPIPTPDLDTAPDSTIFGLPDDFPFSAPAPIYAIRLSGCPPSSAPFLVTLPDGWWTNTAFEHPELGEIAACRYFAPTSFDAASSDPDQVVPDGVAIVVRYVDGGCVGSFLATLSTRETTVDGFPARVTEYAIGANEDDPPGSYEYLVNLAPDVDCETGGRFILAGTGVQMAGDYEANKVILDEMMSTIQIEE